MSTWGTYEIWESIERKRREHNILRENVEEAIRVIRRTEYKLLNRNVKESEKEL